MKKIKAIKTKEEAQVAVDQVVCDKFSKVRVGRLGQIIEQAVIKGVLGGQHRAVNAAIRAPEADQDMGLKIATNICRCNDAPIANLSSLR